MTHTPHPHNRQNTRRPALFTISALTLAMLQVAQVQAAEAEQSLPKIEVTADTLDGATEGNDSYSSKAISIGKGTQSRREVPQSTSVTTRQRMDDQNLTQVQDVIKQTTGMTVQRFDGAGLFSNYYSRGYQADSILLDGLTFSNTGNVTEFDTAIYDRVEVLRGPAGLFQGAGEPGASINLVRKRAYAQPQFQGSAGAGSWNTYRTTADVTSKLNTAGTVRARAVAAYDSRENYKDVVGAERNIAYGTLEIDLTPSTVLSLGATRQEVDSVIDQGLPAYASGKLVNLPVSTFIGAKWNEQRLDSKDYFLELEHLLDNGGQVKFAARHLDRFMLYKGARTNGAIQANGDVAMQNVLYTPDRDSDSADLYVNTPFQFAGQKHNLIVGADWRKQTEDAYAAYGAPTTQNVFNPDPDVPEPLFNTNISDTTSEQKQRGIYGQLRLKPSRPATIIIGGRNSWFESSSFNNLTKKQTAQAKENGQFTPYAAAIYDLNKALSAYVSYAEIFQPQSNLDSAGNTLDPRTGDQYEIGLKGEFLDGRLNSHAALFRIRDVNRAVEDTSTASTTDYLALGKVESKGVELEVSGKPLPNWDITAGYAYTKTEAQTQLNATTPAGTVFAPFTPEHSFNLWNKYQLSGALQDVSLGAGIRSVSSFSAGIFKAPAYNVASAQIGYRINRHLSASLTANNLFDAKYYEKVSGAGRQNFYGEPRNVMLTLQAKY